MPFSKTIAKLQKKTHVVKSFLKIIGKQLILIAFLGTFITGAKAQVKLTVDTLECHIVSFSVGMLAPAWGAHTGGMPNGSMSDLYKSPYIDFGLEWNYKYQNNWMLAFDADLWFGGSSDNLQQREVRMGNVYTHGGYAMSWGGYDGVVTAYNRGIAARPGVAKIITVLPKNPNSGILVKLSGGWFMQKTVFTQDFNQTPVPQLSGNYAKLYDHLRNGAILTESIGFVYMSNYSSYINVKLTFDLSQCWSWSSRPYTIDNLMGLSGKDHNTYFDLLYGFRLTWMFPFTGKTTYDYYYY